MIINYLSKPALEQNVIVSFGMVRIVVHCSAIYAPVAGRTISHFPWQLALDLHAIKEHHLEP